MSGAFLKPNQEQAKIPSLPLTRPVDALIGNICAPSDRELLSQATALHALLNFCRAKDYRPDQQYAGYPEIISAADIVGHLRGERRLAFAACRPQGHFGLSASFIAFDIDASMMTRLSIFRDVIDGMGLYESSFATVSALRDRGKVVISVRPDLSQARARDLASLILDRVKSDARFGPMVSPTDLVSFPTQGEGGVCRILGRSHRPDGAPEIPVDLSVKPINLSKIKKCSTDRILSLTRAVALTRKSSTLSPRVIKLVKSDWSYAALGSTAKIFSHLLDLARELLRVYGPYEGETKYRSLVDKIRRSSPDLNNPSQISRDRRNPLDWSRQAGGAWRYALRRPYGWDPIDLCALAVNRIESKCYSALVTLVRERPLRP
jgi:hypothetical protein